MQFRGERVRYEDLIMKQAIYGCLELADLSEQAWLLASSRDFMRQCWIFWKVCGSALLTYLCDAVGIWEKYGLTFQAHWKHPGPVTNHGVVTLYRALILCNRVFWMFKPTQTNSYTWHIWNRRKKGAKSNILSPGKLLQFGRESLTQFVIEFEWPHYRDSFFFKDVCLLVHALKTTA